MIIGQPFTTIEEHEIIEFCKKSFISGLTILGGDPFELSNQIALLPFMTKYKEECPSKTLWMYTGYIYEQHLLPNQSRHIKNVTDDILNLTDILVDGPFVLSKRDLTLKFRGSSNQRILSKDDRHVIYNHKMR